MSTIRASKENWLRDGNQYPGQCFIGRNDSEEGDLEILTVAEVQAMLGAGGGVWGTITGTLSDQTDLQAALDLKLDIADFTSTADTWLATKSTSNLVEGSNLYYTDERVDDRVAALIQNGTGITWSYNDGLGTLTPTVTITQYTDELAQDAIGAMTTDGTLEYIDATPLFRRAAITGDITIALGSNVSAIAAGVIVNADINASAAIDLSKLATQAANSIVANATTGSAVPTAVAIAASRLVGRDASSNIAGQTVGGGVEFTAGGIQTSAFTGDATKAAGGTALTLATVNANVGTFGSATQVAVPTVNGKGLITAISNTTIAIASTAVTDFTEAAQDAVGAMIGPSLQYVDGTPLLDTIQDIRTTASPTWAGATMGNISVGVLDDNSIRQEAASTDLILRTITTTQKVHVSNANFQVNTPGNSAIGYDTLSAAAALGRVGVGTPLASLAALLHLELPNLGIDLDANFLAKTYKGDCTAIFNAGNTAADKAGITAIVGGTTPTTTWFQGVLRSFASEAFLWALDVAGTLTPAMNMSKSFRLAIDDGTTNSTVYKLFIGNDTNAGNIGAQGGAIFNLAQGSTTDDDFTVKTLNAASAFFIDASADTLETNSIAVIFNNDGSATGDFTVETDTKSTAFFMDASADTAEFNVALSAKTSLKAAAIVDDTGLASNEYTPTLTNVTNVAASTAYLCQWFRVGNRVFVSGKIDIDVTLGAVAMEVGISLPVASNFANDYECAGSAYASVVARDGFAINADAANDRARAVGIIVNAANTTFFFTFAYKVI